MKKYISTKEAAIKADVTEATVINWCRSYGIGVKVGGRWRVSPSLLNQMLTGDLAGESIHEEGKANQQ